MLDGTVVAYFKDPSRNWMSE